MSEFAVWLEALAKDGGKGVVGNIDARCLGRIATLLRKQADEVERLTTALRAIADDTDTNAEAAAYARAALEPKP